MHWSDSVAEKIILKNKNVNTINIASGITPSGKIHVGNLREILTVEFVKCSLQKLKIDARFIFFWDDYDSFRKIPENLENKEFFIDFLGKPLTSVKDPCGKHQNYAKHFEIEVEEILMLLGVNPEYVYQSERYKEGFYEEDILFCLSKKVEIKSILDNYRQVRLEENWNPISIYCSSCEVSNVLKTTKKDNFSYHCSVCNNYEEFLTLSTKNIKLTWRVDWPMRWNKENIHFEPGGKDHSSDGGSRETGKIICKEIFNKEPPVYLSYDFIGIKGKSGKMSSSQGILIGIDELLEIYEPEVIRYLFASYKNNVEFTIGFDLDVIKLYEEYDRAERIYFGLEKSSEKRDHIIKRSYELAQIFDIPSRFPQKISFRHLCNIIQIFEHSLERILFFLKNVSEYKHDQYEISSIKSRFNRASCWIKKYAPEGFVFNVRKDEIEESEIPKNFLGFFKEFFIQMKIIDRSIQKKENLESCFYDLVKKDNLDVSEVYKIFYKILINKDKGPKLIPFLLAIGVDDILNRIRFFNFSSE